MATETINGPLGEVRAASTAGGGTSLSNSATRIVLPLGAKQVTLIPRNFATAVVVKYNKNPWLSVLKTADLLATQPTDYSIEAQDGSTATSVIISSLDTLTNLNALFVGAAIPFSGVNIDVDATNSNTATLAVYYWNGSAWADTSATDGTASGGATMAQDGSVTWTVPSAWRQARLFNTVTGALASGPSVPLFWTRWTVSAALDSSVTLDHMLSINRNTNYAEIPSGMSWEEAVSVGPGEGGIASITALTDAGTANLIVNCATRHGGLFT